MPRQSKGAAKAAPDSLFVWVETGNRRRLMSRRAAEAAGFELPGSAEPEPQPSAPTKKDLLARADELGIEGLTERSKNDDIAAAIAEAEAGQ